jgi:GT2 family glycosyltransferase
MSFPSVHVVILNWNGLDDTLECLASLRKQNYPALKIQVVDNGSAKDEAGIIERQHPEVSVVRQAQNLGFCGGNNIGIKRALAQGAEFVLILNNDTIVPPDCISDLVHGARQLEDLGSASPLIAHYPDTDSIWFAGTVWENQTAGLRVPASGQPRNQLTSSESFTTDFACGCCLLAPASVWREVGLLDERYFAYYEEADWSSRVQKAGLNCYVVPSSTLYHKVTCSTPDVVVTYMMARNRLLWMKDHLSWRERFSSLPYLIKEACWNLGNVSLGVYHNRPPLAPAHSKAMLLAWWDFIRGRFGIWPERVSRLEERI